MLQEHPIYKSKCKIPLVLAAFGLSTTVKLLLVQGMYSISLPSAELFGHGTLEPAFSMLKGRLPLPLRDEPTTKALFTSLWT